MAYLQRHGATGKTPISSFNKGIKWQHIREDNIMAAIRAVIRSAGLSIGFNEAYISLRYLCSGGAMALLVARLDPDTTHLVGRWQCDIMLRYLHTTEKSFTEGLLAKMFKHGAYTLIPLAHAGN